MEKALTFNEVTLSPVTHENQIWIRSADLARALGYSREELVSRLYQRNADEFTADMTQVIEIPVEHQNGVPIPSRGNPTPPTRIFSPRGCHMIAMLSRTPIAKEFRRWVLDVLDRLAAQETQPEPTPATPLPLSTAESRKPLRALVHTWAQLMRQPHSVAWAQVKGHFQLSRIDDMPEAWIPDALAFVQSRIDALPPAEQLALPQGGKSQQFQEDLKALAAEMRNLMQRMHSLRNAAKWEMKPGAYSLDDPAARERAELQDVLYRMVDANLVAAYCAADAGTRIYPAK